MVRLIRLRPHLGWLARAASQYLAAIEDIWVVWCPLLQATHEVAGLGHQDRLGEIGISLSFS